MPRPSPYFPGGVSKRLLDAMDAEEEGRGRGRVERMINNHERGKKNVNDDSLSSSQGPVLWKDI